MNDSTVIQSQQKQEKQPSDHHQESASKGLCGLDDYLLDLVPVVSSNINNLGRSQSKSREDFQSHQ